jgi:hypothetical protein
VHEVFGNTIIGRLRKNKKGRKVLGMISTSEINKDNKEKSFVLPVDTYQRTKKKKNPIDSTGLMPVSSCTRVDLPLPLLLAIGSSSNISLCLYS